MDNKHGLFILENERRKIANKIESVLDGYSPHVKNEEMKQRYLNMYNEQLDSLIFTITQLQDMNKRSL